MSKEIFAGEKAHLGRFYYLRCGAVGQTQDCRREAENGSASRERKDKRLAVVRTNRKFDASVPENIHAEDLLSFRE
jgi:hypothetical protein